MKAFAFTVDEYAAVKLDPSEDIADKRDILPAKWELNIFHDFPLACH